VLEVGGAGAGGGGGGRSRYKLPGPSGPEREPGSDHVACFFLFSLIFSVVSLFFDVLIINLCRPSLSHSANESLSALAGGPKNVFHRGTNTVSAALPS